MNILVLGAGFINKGAEAMLLTLQQQLLQRIRDVRFFVITSEDKAGQMRQAGLQPIFNRGNKVQKICSLAAAVLTDYKVLKAVLVSPAASLCIKNLADINAMIDISGFSYSDSWGYKSSQFASAIVEYFSSRSKPSFFMPQAWGPFDNPLIIKYVRAFCPRADVIYARDQQSYDYLIKALHRLPAKVEMAPDIAFLFQPQEQDNGEAIINRLGFNTKDKPFVGLVPNARVYERFSSDISATNPYLKILIETARYFIEEVGANLILIPHETRAIGDGRVDDCHLCNLIKSGLEREYSNNIVTMTGDYSAGQIKSVIKNMDLLIGSRYHSLVAALSSGVPSVALGWSHKYIELMRLVGLENYVVDYADFDRAIILEKVSTAWLKRKENKAVLQGCLPSIEKDVRAVFDYIVQRIQTVCGTTLPKI